MEKYEWTATRSAPKAYPMEIVAGAFVFNDGTTTSIPARGVAANGWGNTGPTHAVVEALKPIPEKLEITYLSFTENQFYRGTFDLPKEKLQELFKTQLPGIFNNAQEPFTELNVGVAPGGFIIVWMGGAAAQIEVGRYQASKIDLTMQEFNPNGIQDRDLYVNETLKEELSPEDLANLKNYGIPQDLWGDYCSRYNWKPEIKGVTGTKTDYIIGKYYNGEKETFISTTLDTMTFADRAVPRAIDFYWTDKNNHQYGTRISFNEEEIMQAFETLYKDATPAEVTLAFEPDAYNSEITIHLKGEEQEIELKKAVIKIFDVSE